MYSSPASLLSNICGDVKTYMYMCIKLWPLLTGGGIHEYIKNHNSLGREP